MREQVGAAILALLLPAMPAYADIDEVRPLALAPGQAIFGASEVPGAALSIDLAAADYVETEYLVRGTAAAWRRSGDRIEKLASDISYTTRIIVRRPRDPAKFSGVVHFEPIHPSQGGTTHWLTTGRYMIAKGDAYVAAALGDDAPSRRISAAGPVPTAQSQVTKWFDPKRYAELEWPAEDGIRYEVMADIGRMLRSNSQQNPLRGLRVKAMLVGGWSFTGSVQRTFINEGFHDRARLPDGKPVFDGYLLGISSRWNGGGYVPLNSQEPPVANDDPRRTLKAIDAPVIEFLSEFEVATGPGPQRPDRDDEPGAHRLYELGGVIHSSSMTDPTLPRSARPNLAQLIAHDYPIGKVQGENAEGRCDLPISDVPNGAYARAALDNLRQWVLDGTPPPKAQPLRWSRDTILRDDAGNPEGGIRAAEFEVPVAGYGRYTGAGHPACKPAKGRPIFVRNRLSAAELKTRYRSAADYLKRYDAATDRLVRERWLLAEDAAALKHKARDVSAFGKVKL